MKTSIKALVVIGISFICSCGPRWGYYPNGAIISNGWVDDETFRITISGESTVPVKTDSRWKERAKKDADREAGHEIVERFVFGVHGPQVDYDQYMKLRREYIMKNLNGVIGTRRIVQERFTDGGRYEIIFQVAGKNLKRKIHNAPDGPL